MSLKEILSRISKWGWSLQLEFCERILRNIPIGIRSIWSDDSYTCEEKLEAIKWINEFSHKIGNFKASLNHPWHKVDINPIKAYATDYAEMNNITKVEIGAILKMSLESIENDLEEKRIVIGSENEPSPEHIFDLIESENFRKRSPMWIGEAKISNLQSFFGGYYFAQAVHKFKETIPDIRFQDFNEWVANYYHWKESTAGWKNIILEECGQDEEKALENFFELFDIFRENKK